MKKVFGIISALTLVAGAAVAATPAHHAAPAKAAAKAAAPLVCPVTGDKIASIKAAAGSSIYKGKTYYFCCGGCKPQFDANPAKFVKEAKVPSKGHPTTRPMGHHA
ncbi:MAG: YHS domain-containing protein [Chloroflexi bacterium]|nr:YHS domain-containing protein [Chloroflexota bacterium]